MKELMSSQQNLKQLALMTRLLILSATLISCASCNEKLGHNPPKAELCGASLTPGLLMCNDPRINMPDYSRELELGDICTNADDYKATEKYVNDLRLKLYKYERRYGKQF